MRVFAIVPAKNFDRSKSRLSGLLTDSERIQLSSLMLRQTLHVLTTSHEVERTVVVSSDARAGLLSEKSARTDFILQERDEGVNSAVALANTICTSKGAEATLVVPQDLPLLSQAEISEIVLQARHPPSEPRNSISVVICPSQRLDGTNILLRAPPDAIATRYDDNSYRNHVAAARDKGIAIHVLSCPATALDIDTPEDIAEVLRQGASPNPVLDFLGTILRREKNPATSPALGEP